MAFLFNFAQTISAQFGSQNNCDVVCLFTTAQLINIELAYDYI